MFNFYSYLNQIGLVLNIFGSILIAISVSPVKANAYLAGTDNKPIKPLAIEHRFLYGGLVLIIIGFVLMLCSSFVGNSSQSNEAIHNKTEQDRKTALFNCIAEVDNTYANYIESVKGTPLANQFMNGITPSQQAEIDNCNREYPQN